MTSQYAQPPFPPPPRAPLRPAVASQRPLRSRGSDDATECRPWRVASSATPIPSADSGPWPRCPARRVQPASPRTAAGAAGRASPTPRAGAYPGPLQSATAPWGRCRAPGGSAGLPTFPCCCSAPGSRRWAAGPRAPVPPRAGRESRRSRTASGPPSVGLARAGPPASQTAVAAQGNSTPTSASSSCGACVSSAAVDASASASSSCGGDEI